MSITKTRSSQKSDDWSHPFEDHSLRFEVDQLLRENGFEIAFRVGASEAIWNHKKEKKLYPQKKALEILNQNKVADAKMAEDLQKGGV